MAKLDENILADLFRLARNGNQEAYGQFLQKIVPTLRGIANSMVHNLSAEDREDIIQDILVMIHSKGHLWRDNCPVLPWIYAVARHKIIDFARLRSKRYQDVCLDHVDEQELVQEEIKPRVDLEAQINVLGGKLTLVARALGIEGKTISETSHLLNMSENAVRIAFHRALKKIRAD